MDRHSNNSAVFSRSVFFNEFGPNICQCFAALGVPPEKLLEREPIVNLEKEYLLHYEGSILSRTAT